MRFQCIVEGILAKLIGFSVGFKGITEAFFMVSKVSSALQSVREGFREFSKAFEENSKNSLWISEAL